MSARETGDDPVIGQGAGDAAGEIVDELRSAAREAMARAREGAREKDAELWARYRELTKGRRRRQRKR